MIETKYVNPDRSKLFEEINAKFSIPQSEHIISNDIELSSSSKYSGNFEVEIGSDQGSFKVEYRFKNKDFKLFPQRIKVLASILKNRGLFEGISNFSRNFKRNDILIHVKKND